MNQVFTRFLANIDAVVSSFIFDGYARMADAIAPALRIAIALFIMIYGVLLLVGKLEISFREIAAKLGVILLVYILATNADFYAQYLVRTVVDGPAAIGVVVVGGSENSQGSAMDRFYATGMSAGSKLWNRGSFYTLSPLFAAVTVFFMTVGIAAYAAFLLALSKIALAVLLILTPLFALALFFPPLKRMFDGWLGQVLQYALVPVLVYSVLALVLGIASEQLESIEANAELSTLPNVLSLSISGIVAILLLSQVTSIAAGIAGGVALSTLGVFRDTMRKARLMAGNPAAATRRQQLWARHLHRQPSYPSSEPRRAR